MATAVGSDVLHRTSRSLNHRLEQDHRGIKQRHYPLRGFGSFTSASHLCRAFDEVRQFFRVRSALKQKISLAEQREMFRQRLDALPGHACDGLTHTGMRGEPSRAHLVGSRVLSSDTSKWREEKGSVLLSSRLSSDEKLRCGQLLYSLWEPGERLQSCGQPQMRPRPRPRQDAHLLDDPLDRLQ